jgi:hypothetical protein
VSSFRYADVQGARCRRVCSAHLLMRPIPPFCLGTSLKVSFDVRPAACKDTDNGAARCAFGGRAASGPGFASSSLVSTQVHACLFASHHAFLCLRLALLSSPILHSHRTMIHAQHPETNLRRDDAGQRSGKGGHLKDTLCMCERCTNDDDSTDRDSASRISDRHAPFARLFWQSGRDPTLSLAKVAQHAAAGVGCKAPTSPCVSCAFR